MKLQASLLLTFFCSLNFAYAQSNVKSDYMCNKMILNSERSPQWINKNCKGTKDVFEKEITGSNDSEYDPELAATDAIDTNPPPSIILEKITLSTDNKAVVKCVFGGDKKIQSCTLLKEAPATK